MKGDFQGYHGLKQVPDGLLPGQDRLLATAPPPRPPNPEFHKQRPWVPQPAGHSHREPFEEQSGFPQRGGRLSWESLPTQGHPTLANSPQPRARPWELGPTFFKGAAQAHSLVRKVREQRALEGERKCNQWSQQMAPNSPDFQKTPVPGSSGSSCRPHGIEPRPGWAGWCISGEIYME